MPFQVSPGVNISEIDLSTVVPAVSTSIGGFAGDFTWGPVDEVTLVSSGEQLSEIFGSVPATARVSVAESYFTCSNFLDYSSALQVVRSANSTSKNSSSNTATRFTNKNAFDGTAESSFDSLFYGRYIGVRGNQLTVEACDANSAIFDSWGERTNFAAEPGTSAYVSVRGGANDEIHVVVRDNHLGDFSGTANSVLEIYPFLSKASDAKDAAGNDNYWKNVINQKSRYVYVGNDAIFEATSGSASSGKVFGAVTNDANTSYNLSGGTDVALVDSDLTGTNKGYDLLSDAEKVDVSLIMTGGWSATVVKHCISSVSLARLDCVTFFSPDRSDVVGLTSSAAKTAVLDYKNTTIAEDTSYAFMDSGWKYQYDKFNDVYRWIPLNGDIAGLCARTDQTRDAWWSPAGYNRGQIKNVTKLAFNPSSAERDSLYKASVNPVATFTGSGTILFGDKTLQTRPSSFDRINVRRLFIVLEKAISSAAKFSLFEFNDAFTRAQFVSSVEPFLRDVQGRRGVQDFLVVCDETNNTPGVIDRNEFVGDIYIKPNRSINFIQLNFIAVSTGVEFSEIVGKF
jgi:phage tail sheath protein FI